MSAGKLQDGGIEDSGKATAKDAARPADARTPAASRGNDAAAAIDAGGAAEASVADAAKSDPPTSKTAVLPPANAKHDYQLGTAYPPPSGVRIVTRDRNAAPAAGLYNICYLNGYQAQEDQSRFWLEQHPELVLRDGKGVPVVDPDWEELLLDMRGAQKRDQLVRIVGEWIAGCARAGFDAVEIDNLDSFTRSQGLLNAADSVRYLAALAGVAHQHGLAIAQKNASELSARRDELGTDFAIAEECSSWDECRAYTSAYGNNVLMIEYEEEDFDRGCASYPNLSITLRDRDLVGPSGSEYVYDDC